MNFALAAFAVVVAATSLVWTDLDEFMAAATKFSSVAAIAQELARHKLPFVLIELILILSVVAVTRAGYVNGWHHRSIKSREVAERLRMAFPLWALGLRPTAFPLKNRPGPAGTRAIVRQQGMRPATLDAAGAASRPRSETFLPTSRLSPLPPRSGWKRWRNAWNS